MRRRIQEPALVNAPRSFDEKRARLRELYDLPDEARRELPKYLGDKNPYLVGEAAECAKKHELEELRPQLVAAFFRLIDEVGNADRGCFGKFKVIDTLVALSAFEPDVYLRGLHHRQWEGAFPKPIDVAGALRGLCAHALLRIRYREALLDVVPLLFDEVAVTRTETANALGQSGLEGAAAALHIKALVGDQEADVMGAVYKALLEIQPTRYLPFVENALLTGSESDVDAAALAIGEARPAGGFDTLKKAADAPNRARSLEAIYLALALLRAPQAIEHLVQIADKSPEARAKLAVSALALHRHDKTLAARIADIANRRKGAVAEAFDSKFNTGPG
ncbi:MAG: hypothetical protein IPK82_34200 [Polyangiaceae bacterium]|nr:hypothetical protein [Polyangiaceae bacterium]